MYPPRGRPSRRAIRVLSPSTDPPVRVLLGSTASTPTRWPAAVSWVPRASMKVDLPTPGPHEMPTRTAVSAAPAPPRGRPAAGARRRLGGSGLLDSTSVIACDSGRPVAAEDTVHQRVDVGHGAQESSCCSQLGEQVERRLGDDGAGQEHRGRAHLREDVARRRAGPRLRSTTMMSGRPWSASAGWPRRRQQGQMAGGQRATPTMWTSLSTACLAVRRACGTTGRCRRRSPGRRTRWR